MDTGHKTLDTCIQLTCVGMTCPAWWCGAGSGTRSTPPSPTRTRCCTVLYCTVLYCTVLDQVRIVIVWAVFLLPWGAFLARVQDTFDWVEVSTEVIS